MPDQARHDDEILALTIIPYRKSQRHPELVSGSISPDRTIDWAAGWMLKQVQHDEV
jgi:hypothetical protein